MASSSSQPEEGDKTGKVEVTILASEWGSSKGGLSTVNRELAIQLAKFPFVKVTFFLPKCSQESKEEAQHHGISIVEAERQPGYEELDWLSFPPEDLQIDVVVGHGVKLGRQAPIIRKYHKCKWVQVVHTDPKELGMFKSNDNPISKAEQKHHVEVELCQMADLVVTIGSKLTEAFRNYLGFCKNDVFEFTPGIFPDFATVKPVPVKQKHRSVLVSGCGDAEDFELKEFDIAARSVAALPDSHLVFGGAPEGKHEEITERFLGLGIPANRLRVEGYLDWDALKELFCEVDLMLMPSRTEGFCVTGLEALSAGLPVIVGKNAWFGEALGSIPFGSSFVIDSEDPSVWTAAIKGIWNKDRQVRLDESNILRDCYGKKYSWSEQCKNLLEKVVNLIENKAVTNKEIKKKKEKQRIKEMEKRSSEEEMDMTEAYTDKRVQEQPEGDVVHQSPTGGTMRKPSVDIVSSAPAPGISQFQQQTIIEPCAREKKNVQIKDQNSDKDVTQEILKQKPAGRSAFTAAGTPNVTPNISGQSSNSSTPRLTSQQQAEADVRAGFAAQVAATLKDSEEKPKKIENAVQKSNANTRADADSSKAKEPVIAQKQEALSRAKKDDVVTNATEKASETNLKEATVTAKSQSQEDESSNSGESVLGPKSSVSSVDATNLPNEKITNVRVEIFTAQEVPKRESTKISAPVVSEMIKAEEKLKPDEFEKPVATDALPVSESKTLNGPTTTVFDEHAGEETEKVTTISSEVEVETAPDAAAAAVAPEPSKAPKDDDVTTQNEETTQGTDEPEVLPPSSQVEEASGMEKVNGHDGERKASPASKIDSQVPVATKEMKKRQKHRIKEIEKRYSEKEIDMMELYTDKPVQEQVPDQAEEEPVEDTTQTQQEETIEDAPSDDETWKDKEVANKEMKTEKQKQHIKEMEKQSSTKEMDMMEAYIDRPVQEQFPGPLPQNVVMHSVPGHMQGPQAQPCHPTQQYYHAQRPMRIPRGAPKGNQPVYSSPPGGPVVPMLTHTGGPQFIPSGQPNQFISQHVDFPVPMGVRVQYPPPQANKEQLLPVPGPSQPRGPLSHQSPTGFPMRQPPLCILRAPIPGMSQFQRKTIEPRTREKKIIQIKDPNSNRDVAQQILKRKPVGSLTSTTAGTPNVTPSLSGQGGNSSTPPLTSQQQAEANVWAQFAAQVAATLKDSEEKPKKIENAIRKSNANTRADADSSKAKEPVMAQKQEALNGAKKNDVVTNATEKASETTLEEATVTAKSQSKEDESSNSGESAQVAATLKKSSEGKPKRNSWSPDLEDASDAKPDGANGSDLLLQFQTNPLSMKTEGLPDIDVDLVHAPSKSGSQQNRMPKGNRGENMFLSSYMPQMSEWQSVHNRWVTPREVPSPESEEETKALFCKVGAILGKLTPQNFQALTRQMIELDIDTQERLEGFIDLIYAKAIEEATPLVAKMCQFLVSENKKVVVEKDGMKKHISFRKILLNRCQKEFEKENSLEEMIHEKLADLVNQGLNEEELQKRKIDLQDQVRQTKRRTLGNIQFIGELFKLKMLTESIMHDCVVELLRRNDEESFECLCKLLVTIGKDLDHEKGKPRVDQYFTQINKIISTKITSSRVRRMMQDIVDLRNNNWVPRREDNNPKTIDQIQKEAADQAKKTQMKIKMAKQEKKLQRGNMGGRDSQRPGSIPQADESWTTVGRGPRNMSVDPKKFQNLKNIEYARGPASPTPIQYSAKVEEELRNIILKRKARNEEVMDWIDENVPPSSRKGAPFIRALVTVVCEGALDEDGDVCKCNIRKLKDRKNLLQKYIDANTDLEVQALYAVQALFLRLGLPPGFMKSYFDSLFDEEIITEVSFNTWESSMDEEPGKGVTVMAASEFFRWLRGIDEEI